MNFMQGPVYSQHYIRCSCIRIYNVNHRLIISLLEHFVWKTLSFMSTTPNNSSVNWARVMLCYSSTRWLYLTKRLVVYLKAYVSIFYSPRTLCSYPAVRWVRRHCRDSALLSDRGQRVSLSCNNQRLRFTVKIVHNPLCYTATPEIICRSLVNVSKNNSTTTPNYTVNEGRCMTSGFLRRSCRLN